jgi:cytochrome P450
MIDEIITFFIAGMKTIQISSTNLIYYMTKNPEMRAKLLKEILPPVEKAKQNIVEELTYDTVMDFTYLFQCYSESLRIEPPVTNSVLQTFDKDTFLRLGDRQILVKKDTLCNISFEAIH